MIGRLSGLLVEKSAPLVLIDVNGVGYEVEVPLSTLEKLPALNAATTLFIHTQMRDDALLLFGFYSEDERQFFKSLIKVTGIGAKMGLNILSSINGAEFAHYVHTENHKALTKLPGIGMKTAQRLILELKDKLPQELLQQLAPQPATAAIENHSNTAVQEATSALLSLGYSAQEVEAMVRKLDTKELDTAAIIRQALQIRAK